MFEIFDRIQDEYGKRGIVVDTINGNHVILWYFEGAPITPYTSNMDTAIQNTKIS